VSPLAFAGPSVGSPEMKIAFAKCGEGPDVLRRYVLRTRAIYALDYDEVVESHAVVKAADVGHRHRCAVEFAGNRDRPLQAEHERNVRARIQADAASCSGDPGGCSRHARPPLRRDLTLAALRDSRLDLRRVGRD